MENKNKSNDNSINENWKLFENLLVPSWNGDYTNIINVIVSFLKKNTNAEIKLQKVEDKKQNIIAIFGAPKIMLNCHMDTVPAAGKWDTDPFKLTIGNINGTDVFHGLGTCDTKGNLWAILMAVAESKPKNLMLAFTVDEEKGSRSGMENLIEENKLNSIQEAIVFEPTECKFINKHKGYYSFNIEIKTKGGHSSTQKGKYDNAIIVASNISKKLFDLGFNIGKINGGKAGNIVADFCKLKTSIRTYEKKDVIEKTLSESIQEYIKNCNIRINLSYAGIPFNNEGLGLDNDNCNNNKCNNENENTFNNEVNFWTEAALVQETGISTVVYGAGSIEQAHKQNEFVQIEELKKCKKQIIKIINKSEL